MSKSASTVGAAAALAGYDYQLNVSVLAALRLLLIAKSATRITLEPANEEDFEADLAPAEPGPVVPSASLASGYKLVVQVKLRGGEPWSVEDFISLLEHGKSRVPAKRHLDDPDTHYLLVTNADVKGVARDLLVSGFEESPDPQSFPPSLKPILTNAPEGRVAIWGGLTERLIELEIGEILSNLLRVPEPRQQQCREQLRQEARRRMRGVHPGVWTRDDLLATIRSYGGYLASSMDLEAFIKPSNFEEMVSLFEEKSAIVIRGPSGTGKTLAALALCDMARQRDGRIDVVCAGLNDDPSTTRRLVETGPVLFYVEDPWGQYSFRQGSEAWTEQLPRLLRNARPGHQYVITSRSDMLTNARADQELKKWSVELDADHYRGGELALIYDKRMELLATDLQPMALEFRKDVLEVLETPLELDLFFTNLADGAQPGEAERELLRRLLGLAHRDAVEGVVVKYLNSIDNVGVSAVIWGLLVARSQVDRAQLTAVQRQLRRTQVALGDGLEKAVDRLIATRHLRQPARTVAFGHPSVRAGFEAFLKENWPRNEAALQLLISALTELSGTDRAWGMETAARALEATLNFQANIAGEPLFEISGVSRIAIDSWLDESLVDPSSEFQSLLQLASNVGTEASVTSELARWFVKGVRRGGQFFMKDWQPPSFSDAWYDRVCADPRAFTIANRFIREQLPRDYDTYGRDFVSKIDRIASDLTPAFLEVAHKLVGGGFDGNVAAVAVGAVRDINGFETVLTEALDDLAALQRIHDQEGGERWRAIQDGECDHADEEYYESGNDDQGYASRLFVDTYITAKRSSHSWRDLITHARAIDLAPHWAREIAQSVVPATVDEVRAVLDATKAGGCEDLGWDAACEHWDRELEYLLAERILSQSGDERLRSSLARCACMTATNVLKDCFAAFRGSPSAFVHLLADLHAIQGRVGAQRIEPVLKELPPEAIEIFNSFKSDNEAAKAVGTRALTLLEGTIVSCSLIVLGMIVPVMIASGVRPSSDIRRWLTEADDPADAVAATEAAIATEEESLVWLALDHHRADARRTALDSIGRTLSDPLPPKLLGLAADRGSRVRRLLVGMLSRRPHSAHLPILMQLTRDRWSDAVSHYNEPESYPIAREAVEALAQYQMLPDERGVELLELAAGTDDRRLRRSALAAAAELCGPRIRRDIWTWVGDKQRGWERVDAIDALSMASFVESDIVKEITIDRLQRWSAPLATSCTVLMSRHLPVVDAIRVLEWAGQSHSRRALLVLGAVVLASRDRASALGLLDLLDGRSAARRILDDCDKSLPQNVLDDLGDVRIRRYVYLWLENLLLGE